MGGRIWTRRTTFTALLLGVLIMLVACGHQQAPDTPESQAGTWLQTQALTWSIETVDNAGAVGFNTSLALDTSGHPHISYIDAGNDNLKYASYDGTNWILQTADSSGPSSGGSGQGTSLALDSSGHPHIGYSSNGTVKYASYDGTSWSSQTIGSTGTADASLALDSSNHPHLSYHDYTNGYLKYASYNGTSWDIQTVDNTQSGANSLALDSSDHPHISYSYYDGDTSQLRYASYNGTSWGIQTADNTRSSDNSLALDSSDRPHISYYDYTNDYLKYASYNGTSWDIQTVDNTYYAGLFNSLALDSNGQPHISYFALFGAALKYASYDGTGWSIETVDDYHNTGTNTGLYTSLALDRGDHPHISYQVYYRLEYAQELVTPARAIADLVGEVEGLVDAGTLGAGQANGLVHHLKNALRSIEKDHTTAACSQLQAFVRVTEAMTPKLLPTSEATILVSDANAILQSLGCD